MDSRIWDERLDGMKERAARWGHLLNRRTLNASRLAARVIVEDLPLLFEELDRLRAMVPAIKCPCGVVIDIPVTLTQSNAEGDGNRMFANPDASPLWEHYATAHMGLPSANKFMPPSK